MLRNITKFNKKQRERGFSITELSIVLIVIGILLAMTFKGKELITAAKIKAEMAKIKRLETAISIYYAKYNSFPSDKQTISYSDNPTVASNLVEEGLIKEEDMLVTFAEFDDDLAYYSYQTCSLSADKFELGTGGDVCILIAELDPFDLTADFTVDPTMAGSWTHACLYEHIVDDADLSTGLMRLNSDAADTDLGSDTTKGCFNKANFLDAPAEVAILAW